MKVDSLVFNEPRSPGVPTRQVAIDATGLTDWDPVSVICTSYRDETILNISNAAGKKRKSTG